MVKPIRKLKPVGEVPRERPLPETNFQACSTDKHGKIHEGARDPNFGDRIKQIVADHVSESSQDSMEPPVGLAVTVHVDAGGKGWGGWFVDRAGARHDYWGRFTKGYTHADHTSSTSRELLALRSFLEVAGKKLEGFILNVKCDSSFAIDRLSGIYVENREKLEKLAKLGKLKKLEKLVNARLCEGLCGRIGRLCKDNGLQLQPEAIGRDENEWADYLSKKESFDNFTILRGELNKIRRKWGWDIIDRFPSKDIENAGDTFTGPTSWSCWTNSNNYCFPPPNLVQQTLRHAEEHRAKMTLVVFKWKSAPWWSLLRSEPDKSWRKFVVPGPLKWKSFDEHYKLVILRCDCSDGVGQKLVCGAIHNSENSSTQDSEKDADIPSDYDSFEHKEMMAMQNPGQMYIPEPEVAVVHRETADGQAISACTVRSHLHMRPISLVSSADDLRSAAVEEEPSEDSARLQKLNGKVKNSQPERVKETLEESEKRHVAQIKDSLKQSVNDLRASYISSRQEAIETSSGNGAELRGESVLELPANPEENKSHPRRAPRFAPKGKGKKKKRH